MKQLAQVHLPSKLGGFRNLNGLVSASINHRAILLSQMSGYPLGSHVVDHIQRMINLTSVKDLLGSILELRNLVRLASDILSTITLVNITKQQLNRKELNDYIQANAAQFGVASVSATNQAKLVELVSYMIVSSESPMGSWILDFSSTGSTNRFIQIHDLYRSLANEAGDFGYVYDSQHDSIIPFTALKRMQKMRADAKGDPAELEAVTSAQKRILQLAHIRLVDHIYMLMNDVAIWEKFISPRNSSDASQNELRAQSLKMFAAYLHSLLLYFEHFTLEMFMMTYQSLEEWITTFPSIPQHIMEQYESIVRKHDVFNARADVQVVFNCLTEGKDNPLSSAITLYPGDVASAFGLDKVINDAVTAANTVASPMSALTSLGELTKSTYTHLLLSTPVASFSLVHELTESLMMQGSIAREIQFASAGVLPGVARFYNHSVLEGLSRMSLHVPFPITNKIGHVKRLDRTTRGAIEGHKLHLSYVAPLASYDYQEYVREKLSFSIFTASLNDPLTKFAPPFIINRDEAQRLRHIVEMDWQGLFPSWLSHGSQIYSAAALRSDKAQVRMLFELIGKQPFELILRTIANPYSREKWATLISSFGTLYVFPSEVALKNIVSDSNKLNAMMVEGYGKPYGLDYKALLALQGKVDPDQFLELSPTVFIRFHSVIPVPTFMLSVDDNFYLTQRRYYFPGNTSSTIPVSHWVLDDALLHLAFTPYQQAQDVPKVLLDKRYGYANDYLMIQLDLRYNPENSAHSDGEVSTSVTVKDWKQDKFLYFITHNTAGHYGSDASSAVAGTETDLNAMIKKAEQEITSIESTANVHPETKNPTRPESINLTIKGHERGEEKKAGGSKKKQKNKSAKPGNEVIKDDEGTDKIGKEELA